MRDLIFQKNRVELLPESDDRNMKMIEIHAGRAGAVIDHGTGLMMAMPDFHGDPISLNTSDAREAEQAERVAAAVFEKQLLANDFWNLVGRDILSYSRAFIKALPLESVWTVQEGYPVRRLKESGKKYLKRVREFKSSDGKFPFIIQQIPALSILAHLDGSNNVLATIEEKLVPANVLAEDMESKDVQEQLDRKNLKWYDELTVIEYIDAKYIGYFLADTTPIDKTAHERPHERVKAYKKLRVWEHGLGKHPVVMIPGIITGIEAYEDRFKSFLADAQDALKLYDFLLSRLASMVYAYYLPSYEWQIPVNTAQFKGRARPMMKVNLGGVTVTFQDETLKTLDVPQGLPDATMLLQQVDDVIQRHTLEDVLFGRVEGSAPAFQVNLRINVAKSKLTPLVQHMAQGLTRVVELFFRGVEQIGEAVIIDGEKITVSMAKKYRNRMAVQIEPKSPIDRNQDLGAAAMALDFGLPWDWVAENILDIEDPATLRLQKDIQEIEKLPQVQEKLMQDALEQLEVLIEDEDMMDLGDVDLSGLPSEVAEAIQQLTGGEGGPEIELPGLEGLTGGEEEIAPFKNAPEGAASPTLIPRGLGTPNEQPQPGAVQAGTTLLGR
ncbi:hypothetical protein LCGC14_1888390 [marine sediment metagenome]|uniref:Portal protein n=1 Tax=marine sediment metagenome TaxID=412755 RepID=A0A0F9IYE8_9ZZZZ